MAPGLLHAQKAIFLENPMGMVALVSLARTGASNGLHAMASQNPSFEQGTSHSTPGIV